MARGNPDAYPLACAMVQYNYHYLVPEISSASFVSPRWEKIRFEMDGISDHNDVKFHPVLIGP